MNILTFPLSHLPTTQQVGDGSLVIELESDIRDEEGWLEEVSYKKTPQWGNEKFMLFTEQKNWTAAEAHCQRGGGHLASVLSKEEQRAMETLADNVWLGGTDKDDEGLWSWSDGSLWSFQNWERSGNRGPESNCLKFYRSGWYDASCSWNSSFVCKTNDYTPMQGHTALRLSFNAKELTFPSFHVWYKYQVASQQLLNSWQKKKMTGFKLNWFIDNLNTDFNNSLSASDAWKTTKVNVKYQNGWLAKIVELARQTENVTTEEALEKIIHTKIFNSTFLQTTKHCENGQLTRNSMVFDEVFNLIDNDSEGHVTSDDLKAGFMIYSVLTYCPINEVKMHKFLHNLITSESSKTVIKAIINSIEMGDMTNIFSKEMVAEFYLALKKNVNLKYDKVLMATPSAAHKDLAFLIPYKNEMDKCINGTICSNDSIIKDLGQYLKKCLYFLNMPLFAESETGIREVSLHPPHLTDSQGRQLPAALIPFCSYQGSMMGKEVDGLVVCDKFQPTILEGQMCYSLDMASIGKVKTKKGEKNSLLLIIDPNQVKSPFAEFAKIYIHTLAPFSDFRNGSYAMSALKKMIGTKGFLGLNTKLCQVQTFEDCNNERYSDKIARQCECVVWELSGNDNRVSFHLLWFKI